MTVVEDLLSPAQYEAWRACRAPGEMPVRMFARETERSEGTVGNHLRRAEDKLAEAADDFAAIAEHIRDPHAGEAGEFVRGATPP